MQESISLNFIISNGYTSMLEIFEEDSLATWNVNFYKDVREDIHLNPGLELFEAVSSTQMGMTMMHDVVVKVNG